MPATLPRIVCWIVGLTCLGVREVGSSPVFRWRQESSGLGRKGGRGCNDLGKTSVFPRRGCACLGKSAVFPSLATGMWGGWRGVRLGGKGGNGLGKTGIFHRRGRKGGRGGKVGGTDLGKTSVFPGRGCTCLGKSAVFPSLAAGMWGGGEVLASLWGGPAWKDLLSSPGGTWGVTWLLPRELWLWLWLWLK